MTTIPCRSWLAISIFNTTVQYRLFNRPKNNTRDRRSDVTSKQGTTQDLLTHSSPQLIRNVKFNNKDMKIRCAGKNSGLLDFVSEFYIMNQHENYQFGHLCSIRPTSSCYNHSRRRCIEFSHIYFGASGPVMNNRSIIETLGSNGSAICAYAG